MNLREQLKGKMNEARVTQAELARQLKIRPATISDYLTGKRPWNVDKYEEAINYLDRVICADADY
jgi:predicted transcriptional regulator